ncbi:AAA ATPase [Entomortierella chlamydospora]|uniref:AAA ATPase n=1 Tax=Entomortierella chlamydospora TaxID=101097 RepID=A0A9P6MS98_9FUNG|nr:AAA ATPase [Entomortierella chlamydospora]KAG0011024.1 AAA ATPase [Entomortierella chlamydospora]
MSANFLRKRAIVFSDDEGEDVEAWPASPSKRRSRIIFQKQLLMDKNTIAPPDFGNLDDQSTKDEDEKDTQDETEPAKTHVPKTRTETLKPTATEASLETITPPRTPTRRNTRQHAALSVNIPDVTSMSSTPKKGSGLSTPMTPTKSNNQSTGLTPAMNKLMRSSKENSSPKVAVTTAVKGKKLVKELQDENVIEKEGAKIPGYSTPKRLQRTKSQLGTTDASSAVSCKAVSSGATNNTKVSAASVPTTLGFYQDAKTLFRRTTEPHRLVGRDAERETIRTFCQDHILIPKSGSLYISGQPGTGKTALLKEIMRDMEPEMNNVKHDIKTVTINCMSIKDPKLVYQKLLEEIGYVVESKDKEAVIKTLESLFLESNKKKTLYVVILDEVDQLLTKDQEILYKLFQWSSTEGSNITLFGIANALDMTDRFLPRLKARNCEPQLLNFNPYQVAEIRAIIMDRLFSLEGDGKDGKDGKDDTGKPRVVPLMQRPAIELCARKVAAATGDLRKALDICRQTIEMVELEAKKKERLEKQSQQQRGTNSPLTEIRLANLENQAAGNADRLLLSRRQSSPFTDLSPAGSGTGSSAAATAVTTLQDAPKVTVEHVKKALASAFGSPVVQKMKGLNVHQKIVLVVLVTKIQNGKTADCEVGKVFDHYTSTCRSSNKIGAVNRGEYQDLINMLEANGLITFSKAKEERLRKIGLVPQESEVLEAIKGQDILDTIVSKLSLNVAVAGL